MKVMLFAGMLAGMLLWAGAALAYPTLTGPTGLSILPTADTAVLGLTVAADWQDLEVGDAVPIRAQIALLKSLEIGALDMEFGSDAILDHTWGLNAKFKTGAVLGGRSAIGALLLREEDRAGARIDYHQGYVVWTTAFNPEGYDLSAIDLTLGGNWTQIRPENGENISAVRAFAGVTVEMTKNIVFMGEFQSRQRKLGDTDPMTSASVRVAFSENVHVQAGWTNAFNLTAGPDHNLFAGAMINFGGGEVDED